MDKIEQRRVRALQMLSERKEQSAADMYEWAMSRYPRVMARLAEGVRD